jgi:hypothetical protein
MVAEWPIATGGSQTALALLEEVGLESEMIGERSVSVGDILRTAVVVGVMGRAVSVWGGDAVVGRALPLVVPLFAFAFRSFSASSYRLARLCVN